MAVPVNTRSAALMSSMIGSMPGVGDHQCVARDRPRIRAMGVVHDAREGPAGQADRVEPAVAATDRSGQDARGAEVECVVIAGGPGQVLDAGE